MSIRIRATVDALAATLSMAVPAVASAQQAIFLPRVAVDIADYDVLRAPAYGAYVLRTRPGPRCALAQPSR